MGGHLNFSRKAMRLQTRGRIHGVPAEVVRELLPPDDAGDDRAGMNTDAEIERQRSAS